VAAAKVNLVATRTLPPEHVPQNIKSEIEQSLGMVPSFFGAVPKTAVETAWMSMRDFESSEETKLDNKTKQLIGLGVASQIPCTYCVLYHTEAAKALGATEEELREATFMAATTRMWSTVLNGMAVDFREFKDETKEMIQHMKQQMGGSAGGEKARAQPTSGMRR